MKEEDGMETLPSAEVYGYLPYREWYDLQRRTDSLFQAVLCITIAWFTRHDDLAERASSWSTGDEAESNPYGQIMRSIIDGGIARGRLNESLKQEIATFNPASAPPPSEQASSSSGQVASTGEQAAKRRLEGETQPRPERRTKLNTKAGGEMRAWLDRMKGGDRS